MLTWSTFGQSGQEAPEVRLCIAHSYHPGFSWTDLVEQGFIKQLQATRAVTVVAREYLDAKRDPKGLPERAKTLYSKLKGLPCNLYFVTDDDAYNAVANQLISDGKPVVMAGINQTIFGIEQSSDDLVNANAPELLSGVFERYEIAPVTQLIRELVPNANRLLLLMDRSTTANGCYHKLMEELHGRTTLNGFEIGKIVRSNRFSDWKTTILGATSRDVLLIFPYSRVINPQTQKPFVQDLPIWITSHSKVPEFANSSLSVRSGYFATIGINAYEHGQDAAVAYLNSQDPAHFMHRIQTKKYARMFINPERAKALGINVPFELLSYSYALAAGAQKP